MPENSESLREQAYEFVQSTHDDDEDHWWDDEREEDDEEKER